MSILQGKCTICGKPAGMLINGIKCEECFKKFGMDGHPGPIKDREADNFTSKKGEDRNKGIKQMKHLKQLGVQGVHITIDDLKNATKLSEQDAAIATKPTKKPVKEE